MTIALAPGRERERLAAPIAEEGDDVVGELTTSTASHGVEPVDDERVVAADPFEAFARRPFRGGLQVTAACSIFHRQMSKAAKSLG